MNTFLGDAVVFVHEGAVVCQFLREVCLVSGEFLLFGGKYFLMSGEDSVTGGNGAVAPVAQAGIFFDACKWDAHRFQAEDEGDPIHIARAIVAVAVGIARGLQQPFFFVVAQGVGAKAGLDGKVFDVHR